jgi:hypothetical protein
MTIVRNFALVTTAALALAACNQSPADPTKAQSQNAVAAEMAQANTPQAGQYQGTTEIIRFEIPGMPAGLAEQMRQEMARTTAIDNSFCVTEAQARMSSEDRARRLTPAQTGCTFRNFDVSGDRVNATLACSGATITMDGTMGRTETDMRMAVVPTAGGASAAGVAPTIEMRVKTRRTGECTPESRAEAEAAEANAATAAAGQPAR